MVDESVDLVNRFRGEAVACGIPPEEVEERLRVALPAAYAAEGGDGPLVVRLGGNPMLPQDVPTPEAQFVADVDCGLIAPGVIGLPLPASGHLLFFADPDVSCADMLPDRVVYVPAGVQRAERPVTESWHEAYEPRELCTFWCQLSWAKDEKDEYDEQGRWHERPNELAAVWSRVVGSRPGWRLQLGGHASIANWDPVEAARGEAPIGDDGTDDVGQTAADEWVLLATWACGEDVEELDHGMIHWVIRRQDLAALHFGRVFVYVDMI